MDALVIGSPNGLAGAVARALRDRGSRALQAIPADVSTPERTAWLLGEAGDPRQIVVIEQAPYAIAQALLTRTQAEILLVAEQPAAAARPRAVARRALTPSDGDGLTVVRLGRAGRRWLALGGGRGEPMGAARTAAHVLRSCGAAAASCR
jgi:stage V sporulation protein SpoVS